MGKSRVSHRASRPQPVPRHAQSADVSECPSAVACFGDEDVASEVESYVRSCEQAMKDIQSRVAELGMRLLPVLAAAHVDKDGCDPECCPDCDLSRRLKGVCDHGGCIAAQLDDMIARLRV